MGKSYLRRTRASGSDKIKIERAIRRGWQPGKRIGDVLGRRKKGVASAT
jgi:hypothetical protein